MDAESKTDLEMVEKAARQLGEHFDSVQIFTTRYESKGTVNVCLGVGNWYARYGHIREWLLKEEEASRASIKGED